MNRRILSSSLVLIMMLALSTGCAPGNNTAAAETTMAAAVVQTGVVPTASAADAYEETIRIGVMMPITGTTSYAGKYQLEGVQMYTDYVNNNGGIKSMNGRKIELVVSDTNGKPENGVIEIQRLIEEEKVSALIGPYNSAVAAAIAPIAIKSRVPLMVTNAVSDNIMSNGRNKFVYRCNLGAADTADMQELLLKYLATVTNSGEIEKLAIVYDSSDWGSSVLANLKTLSYRIGFEIVVSEAVQTNLTDFGAIVNRLKQENPDAVFVPLFLNEAELFTRQMYKFNCTVPIIGMGTGFTAPEWLENVGSITGAYIMATTDYNLSFGIKNQNSIEYYDNYLKTHNNHPLPIETGNGWLGMGVLTDAVERAGSSDREAIANALYGTDIDSDSPVMWFSLYDGVKFDTAGTELADGSIRYNQNERLGTAAGQVCVQVLDGKWQVIWPDKAKTADIVFPHPAY